MKNSIAIVTVLAGALGFASAASAQILSTQHDADVHQAERTGDNAPVVSTAQVPYGGGWGWGAWGPPQAYYRGSSDYAYPNGYGYPNGYAYGWNGGQYLPSSGYAVHHHRNHVVHHHHHR